MLLTLLGAAFTIGVPTWFGFQIADRYRRRPTELRALQTALAVLVTEVEYGATPLPQALRSAARAAGPALGRLLAETAAGIEAGGGITPGEALNAALLVHLPATSLRPADGEVLQALAAVLGSSGRQDQVRHLKLALERLAGAEAAASEERSRYERMYRYVGLLSGLALVLILI